MEFPEWFQHGIYYKTLVACYELFVTFVCACASVRVQELLDEGLLDQFHKNLVELNMDSAEELQSYINKLQLAVEQGRQRLLQSDGPEGKVEVGLS